ncbi:MAG TPA: hypothetical protein PLJ66_04565 [Methanofastidiosum sp.]|nr:hypothetical protein [Methanofastidiosum sp.]
MNKKEFEAAKTTMREVVKALSPEERAELVKEYRNELLWGKRRLY